MAADHTMKISSVEGETEMQVFSFFFFFKLVEAEGLETQRLFKLERQ